MNETLTSLSELGSNDDEAVLQTPPTELVSHHQMQFNKKEFSFTK